MSDAQLALFGEAPSPALEATPCTLWTPDADGFISHRAPLFARHFAGGDARLDEDTRIGRDLARGAFLRLKRLAALGCLQWAFYRRINRGPWRRLTRETAPRPPMSASVSEFSVFRTAATARLPR